MGALSEIIPGRTKVDSEDLMEMTDFELFIKEAEIVPHEKTLFIC
jgi:hypothetical protein